MKGLFPQYDTAGSTNYEVIWKEAVFVFDTNVLLNLYRYQPNTRNSMLEVLSKLSPRIWIPYQVAVEFQRHRLTVIAEQVRRFTEVRKTVNGSLAKLESELDQLQLTKRHSSINPESLKTGYKKLVDDFLRELDSLQKNQQDPTAPDFLKERIESLFDGRVGAPPSDQKAIDELYRQAEERFKLKIPPGYEDDGKEGDSVDAYLHRGIIYKRKFGDFIVWQQILEHAKASNAKSLVFVTDDNKEDWWYSIKSDVPKTIGPRPELIEEAIRFGNLTSFLMYPTERFLDYAKKTLSVDVPATALEEIREVSEAQPILSESSNQLTEQRAENAVFNFFAGKFPTLHKLEYQYPDFLAKSEGQIVGFEARLLRNRKFILENGIINVFRHALNELARQNLSQLTIVWVLEKAEPLTRIIARVWSDFPKGDLRGRLRVICGTVVLDGPNGDEFHPHTSFD